MKSFTKYLQSFFWILTIFLCLNTLAFGQEGEDKPTDAGTKVLKVGILLPDVKLKDAQNEKDLALALRNTYAVLLKADTVQIVALEGQDTTFSLGEAAKKECDYIISLGLSQTKKRSKSPFGSVFDRVKQRTGERATIEAARNVPRGGGTGEKIARTAAQTAIIDTGFTLSSIDIKIKKKDKFYLNYKIVGC